MKRRGWSVTTGLLVSLVSLAVMAVLGALVEFGVRRLRPESCSGIQRSAETVSASLRYLAPCFVSEVRGGEEFLVASDAANGAAPAIPRRRTEGVPRVAVVGESSGHLLGKHLSVLAATPGCADLEVLNCAQPGSALEHLDRRFEEILAYDPDAIVLLFGHNVAFQFETDEWKLRFIGLLSRSCALSALAPSPPPPDAPWLESRLGVFENLLRGAAEKARDRGVELALATLPANLWLPPASGRREAEEPRFLEARFLEATGRSTEAAGLLESLAGEESEPYWHFQLGTRLARVGGDRARHELYRARDEDSLRMRAPGAVNDMLRRVSAEEGLLVHDAERDFELRAPGGLPGWESFVDNCHLLPKEFDRAVFAAARGTEPHTRLLLAVAEGYSRASRRDRALELNARAREAGGAEAWVAKGLLDLRQGEPASARQAFERTLALDASREDARNFLRWMSQPSGPTAR